MSIMATELGQAYVQIMPSAKGISGSIQKAINPEATAAGKSAGSRIASSIADSMGKSGKTLTKAITVPALGAATAIGGIVAAFGWKRLVAVDAAQAQLKGLGYSAEDVSRISDGLRDAISGGMLTMAEATSAAATAMAAGVKEGDELTRYIQLLDSAVVGGTGTFAEMEQIFGRVVDQGKLTRTEFDMIAQRMPGFSAAVQAHMGVGSEAMYEMLRNGEITTADFLDVMEDFAGGMADAYADSWSGMVQNTLANVGIIGETILGGVFEQSKESIAEFLDYLRSDDLREWAQETGVVIGEVFTNLIETVKDAIEWWTGLDDSTKNLIKTLAGIVVAIGPILIIVSKLITTIIKVHKWFGMLKTAAGIMGGAIGAISAPVAIAIGAIAAIIAIGVTLWKNWDTIKEKAGQLGQFLSEAWGNIKTTTSSIWEGITDAVKGAVNGIIGAINGMINALNGVKINIPKVPDWIPGIGGRGGGSIGFNIPNVPSLDVGTNLVTRDGLAMIHAGEKVVPAKTTGPYQSEDAVYEFNIEIPLDGETIAKKTVRFTSRELEKMNKRTARSRGVVY